MVLFTKQAKKDAKKACSCGLKGKAQDLLGVLANNPFQNPPPCEKLLGDLADAYSRRINIQHRLVSKTLQSRFQGRHGKAAPTLGFLREAFLILIQVGPSALRATSLQRSRPRANRQSPTNLDPLR